MAFPVRPLCVLWLLALGEAAVAASPRNVVIFVADGLRPGSVNNQDAPTMSALAREGVRFSNSHAVLPTLTMPNAAAIATGHLPGDSGGFANALYPGFPIFDSGNFSRSPGTPTPFVENDLILADLDDHFEGNWLGEASLMALARDSGYSTAAIGKLGPAALQDVSQVAPKERGFAPVQTIIIDDATGSAEGVPLSDEVSAALRAAGLPLMAPVRVQPTGDARHAGSRTPNWQQQYFIEATTRAVLPLLRQRGRPFLLMYWSRDPDGTQHNQGDSLNQLRPGINGPTSRAAVRNADDNLRALLEALRLDPALAAQTDVVVVSDHGFATVSKRSIDARGRPTLSYAASLDYEDVAKGFLPPGFLAIDLAYALQWPLFDPDRAFSDANGRHYRAVHPGLGTDPGARDHPLAGNALIGGTGSADGGGDARLVITAGGGSDLIYLPRRDPQLLRQVIALLGTQDYIGALFVDGDYGPVPGALPFSAIGLQGAARLPRPALLVGFRNFALDRGGAGDGLGALQSVVQVADTAVQQGQGSHGSLGRSDTYNFMAALGPDFKAGFVDRLPAGNADIAPTLAKILGWSLAARGALSGRILDEALTGGGKPPMAESCRTASAAAADGRRTVLEFQRIEGRIYVDQARFESAPQLPDGCRPARP
jgi:hypothetical protein